MNTIRPGMFDHLPTVTDVQTEWLRVRANVPQWHEDGRTRGTLATYAQNRVDALRGF